MSDDKRERIVIVGTGAAGLRAAERTRELGFAGELVMVSEEPYRPYHRPALSKQLLTGAVRPRDIVLPVHTELDAIWRYATRATKLDPDERIVHLPGGEEIRYDGLIIATGVQARHLAGAPRHDPRVQVLRTVADAVAVQRAIAHSRGAVVVIGGGFVGCELASAARELGRDATIITRELDLLDKVPGPAVSEMVTSLHRSHGVQLITEASVRHWVPRRDGMALHLSTGQVILAAVVVLGVGAVPAVDWLRGSGLILDDGIMCGPTCHAVGATDVVVAGDVARWPNLRFDTMPRRVEHWLNAIEMGRAAAENLLVGQANARPFTPLPRFWSDQHGVRIQAAGIPALAQDTVPLAGSVMVGHRVTGYVSEGSLVGVVSWDSPRGMLRWTAELDRQSTAAMERRKATRPVAPPQPVAPPKPMAPAGPPTIAMPAVDLSDLWKTQAIPAVTANGRPATPLNSRFAGHPSFPAMPPVSRTNGHQTTRPNSRFDELPPVRTTPPAPRTNGHAPVPPPVRRTEHPSFPAMPPVSRTNGHPMPPPSRRTGHPSFPSMPPASRTNGYGPPPPATQTNGHAPKPPASTTNGHAPRPPVARADDPALTSPMSRINGHLPTPPASPTNGHAARTNGHPTRPPASRNNGHQSAPPAARTNGRAPVSPTSRYTEHPSFPSMPPVSRYDEHLTMPASTRYTEHPSFPSMPPVSPRYEQHPSFPSMKPVSRYEEHPSFPSMPAVSRPRSHDPRFDELFVRDDDLPGMRVPDLPPIDLRAVIR